MSAIIPKTFIVKTSTRKNYLWIACITLLFCDVAIATDFSKLVKQVDPAVVTIYTREHQEVKSGQSITINKSEGLGSGVVFSPDGKILTAAHVVHVADNIQVQLSTGEMIGADVLSSITSSDIAVIKLKYAPENLIHVPLGDSDKLAVGEELFAIGAPRGLIHTFTAGHFSNRRIYEASEFLPEMEFLQTDTPLNPGNSGGPLFSSNGDVIGIVSHMRSISGGNEGLGFAASINMVKTLLLNNPPIWGGLDVIPLNETLSKMLNIPFTSGLLVQRVAYNSPGHTAGIKGGTMPVSIGKHQLLLGGDIIIGLNGKKITNGQKILEDIRAIIKNNPDQGMIDVTLYRQGKERVVKVPKPKPF